MLASSLIVGCRELHRSISRVLEAPKLAGNPRCWTAVKQARSVLLDIATQLQATFPYEALERSSLVGAIDSDPVFAVLDCCYDGDTSAEAARECLSATGHDAASILASDRLQVVGNVVTVPLGADRDYRNWQVVIGFMLARISEISEQVARIITRLASDGVTEDAEIVAQWRSVDQWLSALSGLFSRAMRQSSLYTHYTTSKDEGLDTLLDWTTDELKTHDTN